MEIGTPALFVGVSTLVGFGMLMLAANDSLRQRARIRRRIEPVTEVLDPGEQAVVAPVREEAVEVAPLVAALDGRYPLAGGRRTALVSSGSGVAAALGLVPLLSFFGVPVALAAILGLLLAFGFGWNIGSFMEQRQRLLFSERLLVAVEDFQRMVRFGISTPQAFRSVAGSAGEPVRTSLQRVASDADFGVPLGTALDREARRVRISEMAMLAAIMTTQSRTGGGLSESVGNLAEMLRERTDNRAKIKAATSESKISLMILTGIPFAAIGIQASMQPAIVHTLLNDARHLLGIGIGMIVAGLTVAWFLVRGTER